MCELPALLRACQDAPDEDLPRLVLADWLEETGQPERAEFTRLQIQLHDLPENDPDHALLWARSTTLLRQHAAEWLGPLADRYSAINWRRGLIEVVTSVKELLDRPLEDVPDSFRMWLESAKLYESDKGKWRTLLDRDGLRHFTCLDLDSLGRGGCNVRDLDHPAVGHLRRLALWMGYVEEAEFLRLMRLNLPALRILRLNVGTFTPALGAELARAPWLGGLCELKFSWMDGLNTNLEALATARPAALKRLAIHGCKLGDESLLPLAGLSELISLDLRHNQLTGKGFAALVKAASWSRLETMHLSDNRLGASGVGALADSTCLEHVRTLDLENTGVTTSALAKLIDCGPLTFLRRWNLSRNRVADGGARLLANADCLRQLTDLHLAGAGLTSEGVAALGRSPSLTSLRFLDVSRNDLSNVSRTTFREANGLPSLAGLELSQVNAHPEVFRALASAPFVTCLRRLNLDGNHQRSNAVRPLLNGAVLAAVRDLDLSRNVLGEEGVRTLAGSPLWGQLLRLRLARTDLKDAALKALAALPAPTALVSLNLENNPFRECEALRGWSQTPRLLEMTPRLPDPNGKSPPAG